MITDSVFDQRYPNAEDWVVWNLTGWFKRDESAWIFKCNEPYCAQRFNFKKCGGEDIAYQMALEARIEWNKLYDLSTNDYRRLDANTIEVKLKSGGGGIRYTMIIDLQDLRIVFQSTCSVNTIGNSSVYARIGNKELFHRIVMKDQLVEGLSVDHINGTNITPTRLDNRRINLRMATSKLQNTTRAERSDNTSGVTGVCWSKKKNAWLAQIEYNGERDKQIFGFGPKSHYVSKEAAKEAAIEWREKRCKEIGNNNGKRKNLGFKRKPEELPEEKQQQKKQVVTITTTTTVKTTKTKTMESFFVPKKKKEAEETKMETDDCPNNHLH